MKSRDMCRCGCHFNPGVKHLAPCCDGADVVLLAGSSASDAETFWGDLHATARPIDVAIAKAKAEGAAEERARIVAWLRDPEVAAMLMSPAAAANWIERCEHNEASR